MPSRQGWAVVAAGVTALLAGRLFGVVELYMLGAGLLVLVGGAVVHTVRRRCGLDVWRVAEPVRPEVGDDARMHLHVRAVQSSPAVELWEPVAGVGGAALRVAPLRRSDTASASYRLPTHRRGLVRVGPLSAEVRDAFGLARRTTWLAAVDDVLVHPPSALVPFPVLGSGSGLLSRHLARRSVGHTSADEFRSLRDYVAGDDLRRVNWKMSARRDGLVIRESDPAAALSMVVVFDLHANAYSGESFETAVSVVASLVTSAVVHDKPLRLVTTDSQEHLVDAVHLDEVMEHLALVEPGEGRLPPAGRSQADGMSVAIVVTGRTDPARLAVLRSVAGNVDGAVAVTCAPGGDVPSGWFTVPVRSLADFADQWTDLIGHRAGVRV